MQRYRLDYLAAFLAACQTVSRDCLHADQRGVTKFEDDRYVEYFGKMVRGVGISMQQMDGDKSLLAQIEDFGKDLDARRDTRPSVLHATLKPIIRGVEEVIRNRLFMFIPEYQAVYYMNITHFGDSAAVFPNAMPDMLEASNCYAAGRATACVFHSMRVAEHGLRHIGDQLGIETSKNGKLCPIEYQTWEDVLVKIENKRTELRKEAKGKEHELRTIVYADLASHCAHLKDLWRNPTMHSRGLYAMSEALGSMGRVAEFMKRIASSEYAPQAETRGLEIMKMTIEMTALLMERT